MTRSSRHLLPRILNPFLLSDILWHWLIFGRKSGFMLKSPIFRVDEGVFVDIRDVVERRHFLHGRAPQKDPACLSRLLVIRRIQRQKERNLVTCDRQVDYPGFESRLQPLPTPHKNLISASIRLIDLIPSGFCNINRDFEMIIFDIWVH